MRLTTPMREALARAKRDDGLRRVHDNQPGRPPWPARPNTLQALVHHGLLEHDRVRNRRAFLVDVWRITDAGRDALDPPARNRVDSVRRLHMRAVGVTRQYMGDGVWEEIRIPEPEPMEPSPEWARRSAARHANAVDRRERARALARTARRAA